MSRQKESLKRKIARAAFFVPLLLLLSPILLLCAISYWMYRITLYLLIWLWWSRNGKDVLFISSDSPIWHDYMVSEIFPLVRERAVVLNWSERNKWPRWSFGVHLFRTFGGNREFNPLVVLFRPFRQARTFRFWVPFKDWKRGYKEPVERLRRELLAVL